MVNVYFIIMKKTLENIKLTVSLLQAFSELLIH